MNTTERKTRSAGRARPAMSDLDAIDQIGNALERLVALLNLLCNDCFDGEPFTGGDDNAVQVLSLARSLLRSAWDAQQELQSALDTEAGLHFTALLEQLTAFVTLLHGTVGKAPTVRVFVALYHALDLAEETASAAAAAWGARHE